MRTTLSLLFVTALLAACTAKNTQNPSAQRSSASRAAVTRQPVTAMAPYTNATMGFSINHGKDWVVRENATVKNHTTPGTSFTPPATYAKGTTLMDAVIFVEKLNGACPAGGSPTTLGGVAYSKTNTSDKSTPTVYEAEKFSMTKNGSCYSVILQTNNCTPGKNCDANHGKKFDKPALLRMFRSMVTTFKVQ